MIQPEQFVDHANDVPRRNPLLRTKLHIPPARPDLVPRPHLIARLDDGLKGSVILLSAPAGFGKTTLLSAWIHGQGGAPDCTGLAVSPSRVAWLALDERDNVPQRFWTYLIASLEMLLPGGEPLLAGVDRQAALSESALIALINAVLARLPAPFILVLDDYHVISARPVHDAISFLLKHQPSQCRVVIATRNDPPLPLAHLRARGLLTELRAADLRFSVDETELFLNRVMKLNLAPELVAACDLRVEGWIAGLQLAALSMRDGTDCPTFVDTFDGRHRYIADFLAEQVIDRQPPAVQAFLLATSVLDRLTAPLCDAVTGNGDGQAMLDHLECNNLFILPLDGNRRWYRYHHLFAEALRQRLHRSRQDVPALHRRAATWLVQEGLTEDAAHHALEAKDFSLATWLIGQLADDLGARSGVRTVVQWMAELPAETVRARPQLCLGYAWMLAINGQLDAAERWLAPVEAYLQREAVGARPQDRDLLAADVDLLRAFVACFGDDPAAAVKLSRRALERIPERHVRLRGVARLFEGHGHLLTGDAHAAGRSLIEASASARTTGHVAAYLSAAHHLGELRILQGRLREALAIYQEARQYVAEQPKPVLAGIDLIGIAGLLCEWNDLEGASRLVIEGLALAESGGDFVFLRDGYLARARIEQARGNLDLALAFVQKADRLVRREPPGWDTALVEAWRARLWLPRARETWRTGSQRRGLRFHWPRESDLAGSLSAGHALATVEHWAQTSRLRLAGELNTRNEFCFLTLARLLVVQGRLEEAEALLRRLLLSARSGGRMKHVIESLLLLALTRRYADDPPGAFAALEGALRLAEPEGFARLFLDEGEPLVELLKWGSEEGIWQHAHVRVYAASLLEQHSSLPVSGASQALPQPAMPVGAELIDPLSERELEVLQLVAAGASNREIAETLVVTVNTVRTHLRHINGKLQVKSRTQAVARARALRLLS